MVYVCLCVFFALFFKNQEEGSKVIAFRGNLGRDMEGDCIQSPATARLETERMLFFLCFVFRGEFSGVQGYGIKQLSACGGCLGDHRR